MESSAPIFDNFYRGKRVFITGHTGFKGSWLTAWLLELGADVTGYSKDVPTEPALFEALNLKDRIHHHVGDVRDAASLRMAMNEAAPEVVFHLAAQALVRASYEDPIETFATNVQGTVHVLEAARVTPSLRALVNVTSDKCYENQDWPYGYRESDKMGGADPYSASKGCAELVFASYARSFFVESSCSVSSARAGNVIGGGDFARDRLIPDCVRAWSQGEVVSLRNPQSIRPWQHVLEPLCGYLMLGAALADPSADVRGKLRGEGFNLGPTSDAFQPVIRVVEAFVRHWPGVAFETLPPAEAARQPHEAKTLKLSIDKAEAILGWRPTLSFHEALQMTAEWYRAYFENRDRVQELTRQQIAAFSQRFVSRTACTRIQP